MRNAANILFLFTLDEVLWNAEEEGFFDAMAAATDEVQSLDEDESLEEVDDRCFTRPLTNEEIVDAVLDEMEEEGSTRLRPCFGRLLTEEEIEEEFME